MKPTKELMHEHEIILHMLSGAERMANSAVSSNKIDIKKVENIIDFSRHFTDGCHHSKEEKHLFLRLEMRGMPREQGPIAVMLHEHILGRELIRSIESSLNEYRSGKSEAAGEASVKILKYVELLRGHIAKENNILFPMSDRFLSAEDQLSLEEMFKTVEEETGAGVHDKYHRMAHEIAS